MSQYWFLHELHLIFFQEMYLNTCYLFNNTEMSVSLKLYTKKKGVHTAVVQNRVQQQPLVQIQGATSPCRFVVLGYELIFIHKILTHTEGEEKLLVSGFKENLLSLCRLKSSVFMQYLLCNSFIQFIIMLVMLLTLLNVSSIALSPFLTIHVRRNTVIYWGEPPLW